MARSATQDVVEKFRFKVTFFDFDPSGISTVNSAIDKSIRAGFSEVTLPKASITERTYRENIDAPRMTKAAGLATYEPITFRRGKTSSAEDRGLYNWYKRVNNDVNTLSPINALLTSQNIIPVLTPDYRKDLVIELLARDGSTAKAWFIFNAFPTEYKGGNDLSASVDDKLLEELTISYEAFIELPTADINKALEESNEAAKDAFLAAAIALATSGLQGFL